jgi:hypothetical protein
MSRTGYACGSGGAGSRHAHLLIISGLGLPSTWCTAAAYLGCNARQVAAGAAAAPNSPVGCRLPLAGYEVAGLWLFTTVAVGVIVGLGRGISRGRRRVAGSGESSLMRMVGFAAVVGLAAPAAAVAYLVGFAIGCGQGSGCGVAIAQVLPVGLRPGRRDEALDVYRHLLAGGSLPDIRSSDSCPLWR